MEWILIIFGTILLVWSLTAVKDTHDIYWMIKENNPAYHAFDFGWSIAWTIILFFLSLITFAASRYM